MKIGALHPMGIFKKIKRHAAVASGDFGAMFKGLEIPALPVVVNRLIAETNKNDPDIDYLARLISSETGMAAKVIQTVNSAYYGFRSPISDIKRAVMLMGLKKIRSLALAYGTVDALPTPKGGLFDHEAFWNDSLLRAFLARCFAEPNFESQADEAFTAALLADVAVPILLSVWGNYYAPIVREWFNSTKRLSQIEREHFGWDHAQAGAWIVQTWGFPDELVCYIGAHSLSLQEIEKFELDQTLAVPMSIAANCASVLRPDATRAEHIRNLSQQHLGLTPQAFESRISSIQSAVTDIIAIFELSNRGVDNILCQLMAQPEIIDQEAVA